MRRSGRLLRAAALAALAGGCAGREVGRVENAVLVCLDTVRYDTLELVHDARRESAAARRWSAATRLVRAQSTAPWTLPAVASVFTGLYPNAHGAGSFPDHIADLSQGFPLALVKEVPTLAETLSARGFETVGFVAHPWFQSVFGLERGFATLEVELVGAADLIDRADVWLDARGARADPPPFLLYLHFMEAHAPMHLGADELGAAGGRLPPPLRARAIASNAAACTDVGSLGCARWLAYVEAVSQLHGAVARVLERLETHGLLGRTVVAVFSDHGEEFLDHAEEGRRRALDPRGSYGFGHGHTLYQEQLRVPVAFWHPALAPGDAALPASLADLAPTVLGWLGAASDRSQDGEDLGARLAGIAAPDADRPLFSSSLAFGPEHAAVVRGDRKRIGDAGAGALFFDLAADPLERRPGDPAADRELDALLEGYRRLRPPAGEPAVPTPQQLEQLRQLGYLREADAE